MLPKYRAWDKERKEMHYVLDLFFITVFEDDIIVVHGTENSYSGNYYRERGNKVELLEYTGRKVKDGTEIYDQHFLKPLFESEQEDNNPVCVYYSEENARWKVAGLGGTYDLDIYLDLICGERGTKIIGTYFENPELLEVSHD